MTEAVPDIFERVTSSIESIRDRRRVQVKVHRESLKRTDSSITLKSKMQMADVLSTQKGLEVHERLSSTNR